MIFSSSIFLAFFLPAFLLLYFILPYKMKNYWILTASIVFYAWGAPRFIFVVLAVLVMDYWLGNKIFETSGRQKKIFLALSIALNLSLLFYFKYFNFFFENINLSLALLGFQQLSWTKVLLPIGISFFIFQEMSYTIDIYRGEHAPLKKFSDYMLFIFLFSHLVAGPIVTYHVLANDIVDRKHQLNNDYRLLGFFRFLMGLARKVLIANPLGLIADTAYNADPQTLSAVDAWLGAVAYTFQLYFDFAGYSDMAIGLGKLMGFNFPENFDSPYTSQTITEFWRRWHITLGNWMRNYLYIPLGGNRVSSQSMYANLWLVFLASGIWHGASWNFVLWGAYQGFFIVLDKLFWKKISERLPAIFNVALTFFIVLVGWVFFRANTLHDASIYLSRLFSFAGSQTIHLDLRTLFVFALAVFFSFASLQKKWRGYLLSLYETTQNTRVLILKSSFAMTLYFLSIASITTAKFNPFIYFRF